MAVELSRLVSYLDNLLRTPQGCDDSSHNGLQVEGRGEVKLALFAVDASLQLFETAAAEGADFVFVHHGISWGGSLRRLTGLHAPRLRTLFGNGISLYASHLPLDAHPEIGHNALIAEMLGMVSPEPFFDYHGLKIGVGGALPAEVPLEELVELVEEKLNTQATVFENGGGLVASVGIVSGGGADAVEACADAGYDCLITGEAGHVHIHPARELGVAVIAAGHYATEVPGVEAVMARVSNEFKLECRFIDLPTGY